MNAEKAGWAGVVGGIGVLALSVPAFDMAEDVFVGGKSPLSTLIENFPLVVLGLLILAAGAWLATSDWEPSYVRTVGRVALLNVTGVALLVTLVVLIQQELQGDLKPFVIAADAVIIGALGGVALGIRTAQQERATEEMTAQRDRFQALFDNVPNPIVGVEFVDGVPIVRAVNPAFTEVFGFDRRTVVGKDLQKYIVPPDEDLDPVDRPLSPQDPDGSSAWDSDVVELATVDGRREFVRLTAPVDRGPARDGYAIYIDVTAERQRRERLRVLSRTLRHDIRNQVNVVIGIRPVLDGLEGEDRERVELALAAATELLTMSEQTRRVERQIAGESDPRPRDVTEMVTDAVATVREEFPDATIRVESPGPLYGTVTEAFTTAVADLVRNGVEHNDQPTPTVEVTLTQSLGDQYVDVRIADDGPGIDPSQVAIAEGTRPTDQKTNHLDGLGLWTARWVMQNSGGDLEFEANSPRGTVATLRVSRADPSATAAGDDAGHAAE